jgi:hypothetical protein
MGEFVLPHWTMKLYDTKEKESEQKSSADSNYRVDQQCENNIKNSLTKEQ